MIIGFLNQKGGVGKTTLCLNLAVHRALAGRRVAVIDADPQGSALAWSAARAEEPLFPVLGLPKPTLHKDVAQIARDFDDVLIDGPPRSNDIARAAILASDLILIPVQPSPFDVWASDDTVRLIEEARLFRPDLAAAFVVNRKVYGTAIGRDVHDAFAVHPLGVLDLAICQRVAFAEAASEGRAAREAEPKSRAALEIAALSDAIERLGARVAA